MSGIEVAGLVLGAIPLVISGLEHYGEGARTIKSMWNYPQEFASLSRRMRVEQDIFRNAIELLLSDCVEDAVLADLLDNPGGDIWSDPKVDEALREKMRRSYEVYLETVRGMQTTLERFSARLKLGPDGKVRATLPLFRVTSQGVLMGFEESVHHVCGAGMQSRIYMDLDTSIVVIKSELCGKCIMSRPRILATISYHYRRAPSSRSTMLRVARRPPS
nr:hypothetical protein CFP56_52268 [Quercus suber]